MNIGKLNKRIKYRAASTSVTDGYGGKTVTAGAQIETWCEAKQISMKETLLYGLPEGTSAYRFRFHYGKGSLLDRTGELVYDSRTFRINQVLNVNEDDREVEVIASERR